MKHKPQIKAFNDPARFKFLLTGRRGGKTHLITEDIVKTMHNAPPGSSVVYIGPSNLHAKELIWNPLIDRCHQLRWTINPLVSKACIELTRRRKIYVLGAERISRVRGHKYVKAYLDEVAFFTESLGEVWRALRPTLTDYRGGAICATTPNGKGTPAYDFYLDIKQKDDWSYHEWKTLDNPFIDKQEVENAKTELDEKSFKQEYEASWEAFEGLAYYSFDEAIHVKEQPPINYSLPLHLAHDFNVNPTTLLLSQFENGKMRYKKEYSLKHSSTEATILKFCEDFKGKAIDIRIRGDAAGSARKSNTGRSDYAYVQEILTANGFSWKFEVKASNPAIVDRLKVVNSWLKPFAGPHKVEIDPSCKDLIRDLSSQELNGRQPSDKNNLGHKADAFGYDIFWQNTIESRPLTKTTML